MSENILITGGTGFIGSRLVNACVANGEKVRVLAQANTRGEEANLTGLRSRDVHVILGSVTDADIVKQACENIDVVYHLAAAQHEAGKSDEHFHSVNVCGTRALLEAARDAGVRCFVHGSTIGVYHANARTVRDDSPTIPDNIYGITKLKAEELVDSYRDELAVAVIRISETYGPGDYRLLKLFRAIAAGRFFHIGRERNLHHPVYIDDLVNALRAAGSLPADHLTRRPMVVPGYEALSTREMIGHIAVALDMQPPRITVPLAPLWAAAVTCEALLRPLGINPPLHRRRMHFFTKSFEFSGETARRVLDFEPAVPFAEGARLTARWYRENNLLD